jgi:16S rRNA G527 N7-methylase RsmG
VLRPGLELVLVESSEKKSAFLWAVIRELGLKRARVETRHVRRIEDLADLLPCRYLTLRAVRATDFLKGGGIPILRPDGRALFFVTVEEAERLRLQPPPGLRLAGTRPLPSSPRSILAILEPRTA